MPDSSFAADFRDLLTRHGISHPAFAHNAEPFDPDKPRVLYSGPVFDQEELVAATVALCQGKWSVNGENVFRFERGFSKAVNQAESVMVNSGSSANLLAIAAIKRVYGFKEGDGVIVSTVSFPSTVSAITLNGLTPLFVDVELGTLNFDLDQIESMMEDSLGFWPRNEPKVIFVAPTLGNPPDMDRLGAIAAKHNLLLIGDLCDALGTTYRGKPLNEHFVASTCSLFASHHISCGLGGMVSSNNPDIIRSVRSMSSWAKDCYCVGAGNLLPNGVCGKRFSNWLPDQPDLIVDHRYTYTSDQSYNLQVLDLQGAIGLEQLKKLEWIHAHRRESHRRIVELFQRHVPAVTFPIIYPDADPSWFAVGAICPDYQFKRKLVEYLESAKIQTRQMFGGNLLQQPGFEHMGDWRLYPAANEVLKRVFFLGCAPFYTDEHFAHIEKALKEFTL